MDKLIVEFLGTFALVLVVLVTGNAWAIGATLALAIVAGGAISGGAFNPAVAVGMWMADKIKKNDLLPSPTFTTSILTRQPPHRGSCWPICTPS